MSLIARRAAIVGASEVRSGRISRDLDYYDAATIMKQVGKLPAA